MVINYENNPVTKQNLINLMCEKIFTGEKLYEEELAAVLKGVRIENEKERKDILKNPRKGWGWRAGTLRYFMNYDERSMVIPQSNKLDKDEIDELRSEDICIRANKVDILESLNRLEEAVSDMALTKADRNNDILIEVRTLKQLIKGE